MQLARYLQRPIIPATALSLVFSLALFGMMYSVIHSTHQTLQATETLPTIDFVRLKRDSEIETMSRRRPPPPPAQPPPPAKMRVATEAVQQEGMGGMALPDLNLAANVSGGPIGGKLGRGAAMFDGELIPLQRVPPQYPREAARARISGWVEVEVLVNADGTVRSARAIKAEPKGLFEAAAVQSALRSKFKPKIVDGKPVEQKGSWKVTFDLSKPEA
jgi:protein TonB